MQDMCCTFRQSVNNKQKEKTEKHQCSNEPNKQDFNKSSQAATLNRDIYIKNQNCPKFLYIFVTYRVQLTPQS